jgi:hypothetical protein
LWEGVDMHFSIPLLIISLVYLLLIAFLFFSKEKIKTTENNVYTALLITTILGIILDIAGIFAHLSLPESSIVRWLIVKFYMLYLLTFTYLITIYIVCIGKHFEKENLNIFKNKTVRTISVFFLLAAVLNFILPFTYYKEGNIVYIYGPNCIFLYAIAAVCIIGWIIYILRKRKDIEKKKILPIISFSLFCIPVVLIQLSHPEMLLVTSLTAFVVVFMYHTIENPDLKLINELNLAKDQAEKANNAKSEFLSSMSHEIRTPLNAIVGFSQALAEEEISNEAKEEVNDIIMASENLLEIVNGILDISKIEANKLEIVNTEYEPAKILEELVALSKARLGEKPIEFRTSFDPLLPKTLFGDYMRIKQITLNLLTNAIKYTKTGYIEFRVSCIQKENVCRLIISVEDSGIGIQKEKIDKLFTKFERFDIEKNITIEGTGLGLAITKKLVELMNGKIVVQSIYGQGSKFTVALDQQIVLTPTVSTSEVLPKEDPIDLSLLVNKKVLIVDDNKINLKVASRLLKDYNIKTEEVDSGFECINRILQKEEYDLILLDDMMPKMSGVETLKKLKEISDFHTPTIALTANAISGMKEKYLKEGFDDYLSKPIDRKELNRVIRKFLNTK